MAQLLAAPMITALNASGAPISGAKLFGYLSGTTTAITLYQDSGLTTPHTVPVLADSAGRFPAIYYDDSVLVRIKVFDASSVLIRDTDPVNPQATVLRGYLSGLTLSTAGSSATFSVAAGQASDSTFARLMVLAASLSKTTSSWAAGSSQGGLDTGTIANSTWYHVHLITRPDTGVVDVLISLSASSPTLPSNYTKFRRIGSLKTDSGGHWTAFTQSGDEVLWLSYQTDTNTTYSAGAVLLTLGSVPPGVNCQYIATLLCSGGTLSTNTFAQVSAPDIGNPGAASTVNADVSWAGSGFNGAAKVMVRTNTAQQVYVGVSTSSTGVVLSGRGYVDRRGRDA